MQLVPEKRYIGFRLYVHYFNLQKYVNHYVKTIYYLLFYSLFFKKKVNYVKYQFENIFFTRCRKTRILISCFLLHLSKKIMFCADILTCNVDLLRYFSLISLMKKDHKSTFLVKISLLKIHISVLRHDLSSFTASLWNDFYFSLQSIFFASVCRKKCWWSFSRKNVEFSLENSHIIICMCGKKKTF